jgi:D,D-heptose 1,7-bisphosphate phosphatase
MRFNMKSSAVFLDRDGVINEVVYHKEMGIVDSPFTVKQFKLLKEAGRGIKKLRALGYKVIIVSNQPGVAKNHHSMTTFERIRQKMHSDFLRDGTRIDGEYYCFHHPDAVIKKYRESCDCRKPMPGMILRASREHDIVLSRSWMIGDGISDIKAGISAGCKTILIGMMKCDMCKLLEGENARPSFFAPNLYKASLIIEKERMHNGNIS